ncbi:MAG: thermonuclease family protein [Desulfomonile tiedjei]|uniref:Thermonuclease family protein n=1 Tax=Desulfomonile tiedjei TaxID=2358 RepID=A0A9D6V362_9BACT|nr:thermonuclease family protein [Desulfomonile tiedjei]
MRKLFFWGCVLVILACGTCFAWTGKVVGIADGDTIRVMHAGKSEKIRLYGVDSPERDQDFGAQARKFTSNMVFGKNVDVQVVTRDRYGRTVAWVSVEGKSLNKDLVKAGLAWWYEQFAKNDQELKALEFEARQQKIGLWSTPNPIPPWKFRNPKKDSPSRFRMWPFN